MKHTCHRPLPETALALIKRTSLEVAVITSRVEIHTPHSQELTREEMNSFSHWEQVLPSPYSMFDTFTNSQGNRDWGINE
jgi:hypothetical protein